MLAIVDIVNRKKKISLVGLGYVGLPIAISFAKKADVIGFDINTKKINLYKKGVDPTREVGNDAVAETTVHFTDNPEDLKMAHFHVVAVPTPISDDMTPDLSFVESACQILGKNLSRGSVVVFESTVYPGVTEDLCVPILESESGLCCGVDFKIGYSPERINPGDKEHRLESIVKIVSGMDSETLEVVAGVYEMIIDAGVYRAQSIQVAEAAKVIENSQRDINIAFVNELSIIFNKMGIDTLDVLKAAGTKWNFLNFKPGLVGGHCIGIDPYYLTYRAEQFGYHSQVILSGRRINDGMGKHIVENIVKRLFRKGVSACDTRVAVLGITFKENCPDTRNTKVIDIINELKEYGISPLIYDPVADAEDTFRHYSISFSDVSALSDLDVLIVAVAHEKFKSLNYAAMLKQNGLLADIKGIVPPVEGCEYWRL